MARQYQRGPQASARDGAPERARGERHRDRADDQRGQQRAADRVPVPVARHQGPVGRDQVVDGIERVEPLQPVGQQVVRHERRRAEVEREREHAGRGRDLGIARAQRDVERDARPGRAEDRGEREHAEQAEDARRDVRAEQQREHDHDERLHGEARGIGEQQPEHDRSAADGRHAQLVEEAGVDVLHHLEARAAGAREHRQREHAGGHELHRRARRIAGQLRHAREHRRQQHELHDGPDDRERDARRHARDLAQRALEEHARLDREPHQRRPAGSALCSSCSSIVAPV